MALAPGNARAQLAFEWIAPPGCGDAAEVTRRVEDAVGGPLAPRARPIRVEIEGSSPPRARIHGGGAAERVIDAADCEALEAPVALVLALLLSEPETVIHAEPARRSGLGAVVGASATLTAGLIGEAAGGAGFSIDLDLGQPEVALRLAFEGWPAQRDGPGPKVELSGWAIEVALCGRPFVDRWLWLGGCASVRAGTLSGLGVEVSQPESSTMAFAAPGASAEAIVWPLAVLGVRASIGLSVPLPRGRWTILEEGTLRALSESAPVAFAGSLSVVLRLGP